MKGTLIALVGELYEDLELWYPRLRLEEAGYPMILAAQELRTFTGKHGYPAKAETRLSDVHAGAHVGLLVPGGYMPDQLRRDPVVIRLIREFHLARKLVAFTCHGGSIPISAHVLRGRRVTGSLGIKDDLENAGAVWEDAPVVVDGNLVSSRTPRDLAAFGRAMVEYLEMHPDGVSSAPKLAP